MGDPVQPVDIDAVVENDEPEGWEVLRSGPRWEVWRRPHQPHPLIDDRRKRHAAIAAGAVVGVLGIGGVVAYGFQWQVMHFTAMQQIRLRHRWRWATTARPTASSGPWSRLSR